MQATDEPPHGGPGYRTVVAGLALGQTLNWAILYYGFSSFVLPMVRELGWDKPTLMGAFTLGLLVCGLANYAVGAAIDRGHGRAVMAIGCVLGGLACGAWALATQPWMLYAALALAGVAMAMTLYEPAFAVLTKRYPTRYRQGITALTLVAGFASTVSFPACALLINALGWRGALGVMAATMVLLMAPLHAWLLRGPALGPVARTADAQADATLHEALRHRPFWLLTLAFVLYALGSTAVWAHVMPALAAQGLSEAQALAVVVWVGPAQVAGRLAQAWLGHGVSLHRLGVVVMLGLPLALTLLALGQGLATMLVFALVFGLANGLVTIVRGALVPEYFGRAHIGRIGGLMSGVSLVARAAAPVTAAALLVGLGSYPQVWLALAALAVLGALAFAAAGAPGQRS